MIELKHGDCLEVLQTMPDNSVDSIVSDPPYGLAFMGKKWDYDVPGEDIWRECLRVLKPGGHLLAFAGTRTQHRMAVRIEDAGFEIRDMIAWVYGSGFPKSLDVSKAIDKAAGAEREVVGVRDRYRDGRTRENLGKTGGEFLGLPNGVADTTAPATPAAQQWAGWGTALKPALEPITVARKPFPGTVAGNVQEWGTGGVNVDGCRVGISGARNNGSKPREDGYQKNDIYGKRKPAERVDYTAGRWPANLIHDGSDEVTGLFPVTGGGTFTIGGTPRKTDGHVCTGSPDRSEAVMNYGDTGSAARFFYCAKASKKDRDEGCEGLGERERNTYSDFAGTPEHGPKQNVQSRNHHPTVKPTDLMRYLCRLVTPPGGVVLDPFMGSGSTGKAAVLERFGFIGIDREAEYVEIARCRIAAAEKEIAQKLPL